VKVEEVMVVALENLFWLVEKKTNLEEFLHLYMHQNLCFVNDFALKRQSGLRYH
jgi:hypothetical protein